MIRTRPTELTLTLAPQRRFEAIDVNRRIAEEPATCCAATAARSTRRFTPRPAISIRACRCG